MIDSGRITVQFHWAGERYTRSFQFDERLIAVALTHWRMREEAEIQQSVGYSARMFDLIERRTRRRQLVENLGRMLADSISMILEKIEDDPRT